MDRTVKALLGVIALALVLNVVIAWGGVPIVAAQSRDLRSTSDKFSATDAARYWLTPLSGELSNFAWLTDPQTGKVVVFRIVGADKTATYEQLPFTAPK